VTKKKIPVVKPLKVPEPCVIDELPEVVTVVDRFSVVYCSSTVTLFDGDECSVLCRSCRYHVPDEFGDHEEDIRYVAGVE
jgi:hypothetical protein